MTLTAAEGYAKYRGKCKEYSEAAVAADPTLRIERGWYFCPIWGRDEEHWWCVRQDGTIFDPTREQFPSAGRGTYEPFNGRYPCRECGESITLEAAEKNDGFCSNSCYGRHVGIHVA